MLLQTLLRTRLLWEKDLLLLFWTVNNNLWVLSSGGINEEQGELNQIDPSTNNIIQTMVFSDISNSPNNLKISPDGETIYYLNNGVNQLSIYASSLPSSSFINQNGALFYGLGISPTNDIYVSDAVDYVQSGIVYRYDSYCVINTSIFGWNYTTRILV